MNNKKEVDALLKDGAIRASIVADKTILKVKKAMLG